MSGKLYIVSTPIGNLKDITLRALETLKEVDFIVCEDTRVTGNLLNHYEIKKELVSLNAVSENRKSSLVCTKIENGENCALTTDAGTPSISDPGVRLISEAIKNNIEVISIPGPTALIAGLSISGLPTDSFVFEGFIPQKKGRQKKLKQLSEEERTIVLYESTYRIEKLLNELNEYMPFRIIAVCREITKKFEEVWRGKPKDILDKFSDKVIKGEFVVIISSKSWKEL
ncbi:MAG: 16S rRNA (cytidine(1402)-2'-O)-methyltransferase [Ignavibacteriales bacterium CG_4_9_14_3_um_filter_30_11]|nr:16S rRNA (cytidine(1402)-2'-O)-methyltransferase [Ignavibacteria bacterium]PJA99465.1 MAG: 16S rRNA (cytidine(1402)-2'-O)-methyltransferase [Ignavibacteriales bacterium CG_4_9_14_3_um_filter_30_11]